MTPPDYTQTEAETREEIDRKLIQAGWVIQDKKRLNLYESLGVAVREMDTDTGPADYMLFIDGKACGVIEAKREGASLVMVAEQSGRYATSGTKHIKRWAAENEPLPFLYEATNFEIRFRDERNSNARSRNIFHFHQPETLHKLLEQDDTLRARLQTLPELDVANLRDCQVEAISGLEDSLAKGQPRSLLQMATGAGKTFTAVTECYRLAKFARAKRILFLVDRGNLGRQALKEFQQYTVPNDGRKFTDLYNVHQLGTAGIGDEIKVTISTIQRLYSQLSGKELDEDADERSGFEVEAATLSKEPRPVRYNPAIPIESFDFIIVDECHRSIYNLWRQVLDYFDAFLIGLTATPTKKTIGFFNQNMVAEYTHEEAVIDRVNVGYDIYRIKTKKSEAGDIIEAGTAVEIRDRLTKQKRLEVLDEDENYTNTDLDRSVLAPNQIRTVLQAYRDNAIPECFPERGWVPKTLIFAKDDDHAERIVDMVREVFAEGNDFCKKVTYRVGKKTADDTIAEFRTSPRLRIAVTVDMIATGTDIKPLECLIFMRDVRSQAYYEQMKGRGTRVIGLDELHKVTPDARAKTRFVLIDAVGVTETDKTETRSLESKPSVSTEKLMAQIARGDRDPDTLRTLGNRLLRLDMKLTDQQRKQITDVLKNSLSIEGEGGGEGERVPVPEYLIESARELRKNQTDAEELLWQLLRSRQIADCKFRRQHPVEPYILDFYCHDKGLAIELDGGQHNTEEGESKDRERTEFLESSGIHVMRFWNNDVLQNTEGVLEVIYNALTPTLSQGERELVPLTLVGIAGELIHATNEDRIEEAAKGKFSTEYPSEEQCSLVYAPMADEVVRPFHSPDLREKIEDLRRNTEQIIDDSADELVDAGYDAEKAQNLIGSFKQFIDDHKDELTAIQLIYSQPYQKRHLSYEQIEKLAEEIEQPPYNIAPVELWKAYEQLEKAKVKGTPVRLLTNIISLIRFATGLSDVLEPFPALVDRRFAAWLTQQNNTLPLPLGEGRGEGAQSKGRGEGTKGSAKGGRFSPDQLKWLELIKAQIAQNAEMTVDDFEYTPFNQEGGLLKARQLFGQDLNTIIDELNGYLIA